MARFGYVVYICDRCGSKAQMGERRDLEIPPHWGKAIMPFEESGCITGHKYLVHKEVLLCEACSREHDKLAQELSERKMSWYSKAMSERWMDE